MMMMLLAVAIYTEKVNRISSLQIMESVSFGIVVSYNSCYAERIYRVLADSEILSLKIFDLLSPPLFSWLEARAGWSNLSHE